MSTPFDVTILGDGIVGRTLALLLARERLRVALVGAGQRPPSTDIRAYALNHAARDLLQSVRAWPDGSAEAALTPVQSMWVQDHNSSPATVLQFAAADVGADALSWIVDVAALEQRLDTVLDYQPGIERRDSAPKAALTVVCEGRHSRHRQSLGFGHERQPYPHTAVAARLQTEHPHGGVARQWFVRGDIVALLPMDGPAGHTVALVWSLPHARAQRLLDLPAPALAGAVAEVCDHALGGMELLGAAAAWPLERAHATHWVQPGQALAGDAAHAMHPLAGQGLNVGLADVATLARVIREREYWRPLGDMRLLRRYERARQADVALMSGLTDSLFGLFDQPDPRIQVLRQWGMRAFERLAPVKHWTMRHAMGL